MGDLVYLVEICLYIMYLVQDHQSFNQFVSTTVCITTTDIYKHNVHDKRLINNKNIYCIRIVNPKYVRVKIFVPKIALKRCVLIYYI